MFKRLFRPAARKATQTSRLTPSGGQSAPARSNRRKSFVFLAVAAILTAALPLTFATQARAFKQEENFGVDEYGHPYDNDHRYFDNGAEVHTHKYSRHGREHVDRIIVIPYDPDGRRYDDPDGRRYDDPDGRRYDDPDDRRYDGAPYPPPPPSSYYGNPEDYDQQ